MDITKLTGFSTDAAKKIGETYGLRDALCQQQLKRTINESAADLLELAKLGFELAETVESRIDPAWSVSPSHHASIQLVLDKARALREKARGL